MIHNYRIYLIKRPGVYFRSKSLEGAFNPGGRLLLCLLQNSCTAAVIVLFLGCCFSLNLFLSLNLSHRSALCVGISLSLPSMHRKKVFLFYATTLATGSTCYFSSTHSATPHTWAIIQDGRLLTKTELLPRAFIQGERLIK